MCYTRSRKNHGRLQPDVGTATFARAHATLEVQEADVGGAYEAVMSIGRGCEGKPTIKLSRQARNVSMGAAGRWIEIHVERQTAYHYEFLALGLLAKK